MTIVELIEKATKNPENINEDGSINWNFVDADIHMDNSEMNLNYTTAELVDGLDSYNPVVDGYEKCVLCEDNIMDMGHNPYPLSDTGRACEYCNDVHVIPARLEQIFKK